MPLRSWQRDQDAAISHVIVSLRPTEGPAAEQYCGRCYNLAALVGGLTSCFVQFEDGRLARIAFCSLCLARAELDLLERIGPMVSNPVVGSTRGFYASDDRYFFHEADRRAYQRLLDERAERLAARVRARQGEGNVA